ncbi:hypothetical protein CYQ88_06390 [Hydrogenovibrio sp. SC-1]|uniref:CBS domain-containing protein n=1 Tax=Hydrogenovibrio sp. SC-1 TaxID=2065820 RepID=UPI000C7A96F7|nr:CBS domain-containing protein [Hydrogenovibrio sp. SC-1]PLA74314.1 hypothetical protein CYQ88_06390 [Hydrogenovibrio sp. SC-1]
MFIVYSPEGRNRVTAAQSFPELKVDRTKETLALGESEMDQMPLRAVQQRQGHSRSALKQYDAVQHPPRTPVVKIAEIMVAPVITIELTQSIDEAWALFENAKIHHLPVMDDLGVLVGILTTFDLLTILFERGAGVATDQITVADWMKKEVVTTKVDTDIRRVAYVMSEYHLSCMPIMSEVDEVVGIVTQSDIVRRLGQAPPLEVYA